MNKIVFGLVVVASLQAFGCASGTELTSSKANAISVDDEYAKMVGRWQFVYDDARRATVEAELTKEIADPSALAAAKKDAEAEAAASTIELTADREYRSFIGTDLVFHDRCAKLARGTTPGSIECTPDLLVIRIASGKPMMRLDGAELVMTDPKRGDLHFRRIR
ncbi:hypothetical protein BH09MYX1_BH09MYX1_23690 [soil metagenome]